MDPATKVIGGIDRVTEQLHSIVSERDRDVAGVGPGALATAGSDGTHMTVRTK